MSHPASPWGGPWATVQGEGRRLAFLGGEVLQVNHDGEVEARLGCNDVVPVLPLQHLLGAVLDQVLPASYVDREHDLALRLGCRYVEEHAVEVRDRLVDRRGRCAAAVVAALASRASLLVRGEFGARLGWSEPGEPLGEDILDEDVLVVEEQHLVGLGGSDGVEGIWGIADGGRRCCC